MRRALAAVAMLAILPAAHAQDKAKGDVTHSGEFRLRDNYLMNRTASDKDQATHDNDLDQRFKFDLGFKASEKLAADVTLLNNIKWGGSQNTAIATPDGSGGSVADFLTINQAYVSWMVSDDIKLKFGRQNYQIADGSLIAHNDWQKVPYAFEGILGNYEAEFGKVQAFAFKFRDDIATATAADPERNAYGLNFDLKTMPEFVKAVNVHVLKDTSDASKGDAATTRDSNIGRDMMRYGLHGAFNFSIVDFKVWYEAMTGKLHHLAADGTKTDHTASGNMMQFEVGANLNQFMNSHAFFRYHKDTGNKDDSATDREYTAYDPYFNEQHGSAGMMDLLGWGNLTFMELGATMKPMDNTEVGVAYWMFSKTEKSATTSGNASGVTNGNNGALPAGDATKSKIGDEIDVWAAHNYGGGLSTIARVGYFMPGDVYNNDTVKADKKPLQVFIEGRLTF